jgi:hypothetical protein
MKTLDSLNREDKVACIKNWVEELNQENITKTELLEQYRKAHSELTAQVKQYVDAYSGVQSNFNELTRLFKKSQLENKELLTENEKLKTSKSLSEEEINKLVNDKITSIFSNPLTYLMSLPITERNELIGRIYTAIIGVRFR